LPDPHTLSFLSIPTDILVALDYRPYRFFLQPYHHLVRMLHILSISAFFGAIVLLDMRLAGFRTVVALKDLSGALMSWIYVTFGIGIVSGIMLFFYDPVHVASHAYFSMKLVLIAAGLGNAAVFNQRGFTAALAANGPMPRQARIVGAISLVVWTGAMICATLNVEAAPKVLLR
jgi:hypothetical protein